MKTIAYASPFVPPEWIAAHGLRPTWLRLRSVDVRPLAGLGRGTCPYAGAMIDAARSAAGTSALVLTTTCDQMRYAAALIDHDGNVPVFLMNVPSTWQTTSVRQLYLKELVRLGRFLVRLGGMRPEIEDQIRVMLEYDRGRSEVRAVRRRLSARQLVQAMTELRGNGKPAIDPRSPASSENAVPLALIGGPLVKEDGAVFDLVERAGGCVVLDATEQGERTMPRPFDAKGLQRDPVRELADAYFGSIPDVFRRPNTKLYEWLEQEVAARGVRGILFRRYVWCDLWHAELHRLRQRSRVPILEIEVADHDVSAISRVRGQIEAFLEMLT
ncbi:2-hydroxyacyl-CoA dehydratase [Planctomycetota bacterium]